MSGGAGRLEALLQAMPPVAVAVSGGVDSMTLAVASHRLLGKRATMAHAVSPAVPERATQRVREWAESEGWKLYILDAGEFNDENYLANPLDRCFFCKGSLYGSVAARLGSQILSGTNTDDLGEYRPGLLAARDYGVRHPYVEAGMNKAAVRRLARDLGLGALAELPASPCLSSRVETLTAIKPDVLPAIDRVELMIGEALSPSTVRCRVRSAGIVIELDSTCLAQLTTERRSQLAGEVRQLMPPRFSAKPVSFAAYRVGSAFVGAPL